MTQILRQEFANLFVAIFYLGGQEEAPVVHGRRVGIEIVRPLAHDRAQIGALLLQQRFLRLGGIVQRRHGLARQMAVIPQRQVQVVNVLAHVVLLSAEQLLQRRLRGRHVAGQITLQRRARLGRFLHAAAALLQRNGCRLHHGRARRLQLTAPIFTLVDKLVGRRLDHVVKIAALLLRLVHGIGQFGIGAIKSVLYRGIKYTIT